MDLTTMGREDARVQRFRLRCGEGHSFAGAAAAELDFATSREELRRLVTNGMWVFPCPLCDSEARVAEPVLIAESQGVFTLFIPEMLGHRELELRAAALGRLSRREPEELNAGTITLGVVIGAPALLAFCRERFSALGGRAGPRDAVAPIAMAPRGQHAPTSRLAPLSHEDGAVGLSSAEPINDVDDWVPSSGSGPGSSPPQRQTDRELKAAPRGRTSDVDFAELLSREDEEPTTLEPEPQDLHDEEPDLSGLPRR